MCIAANVNQKLSCSQAECNPDNHVSNECPVVVCIKLCMRFSGSSAPDAIGIRCLDHLRMMFEHYTG